jgi:hypothetical protein
MQETVARLRETEPTYAIREIAEGKAVTGRSAREAQVPFPVRVSIGCHGIGQKAIEFPPSSGRDLPYLPLAIGRFRSMFS